MAVNHAHDPSFKTFPNNKQMGLTRRAVCSMQVILACMLAFPGLANAAILNLCWTGGSGYTMTGRMELPDSAMRKNLVTQDDISAFQITGYLNGNKIGAWDMRDRTPQTTWFLRFQPETLNFPVGGNFGSLVSQGWNANGNVTDCGNPGFGFNSGNYAQDVCVNGKYVRVSSIDPTTPLVATYDPVTPDCRNAMPMSKSRR